MKIRTCDTTSVASVAPYFNTPNEQFEYLLDNAGRCEALAWLTLHRATARAQGFISKSYHYIAKILNYSVRHSVRIINRLVELGCLIKISCYKRGGHVENQYRVVCSPKVVEKAFSNPPRKRPQQQFDELEIYKSIDFSIDPDDYDHNVDDYGKMPIDTPPVEGGGSDKNVTPLILSSAYIINNNTVDNFVTVAGCAKETENVETDTTGVKQMILDRDPITLPEHVAEDLKRFVRSTPNVSNPRTLFEEIKFVVSRKFFPGQTLLHAINTAKKLVRSGKWTTPFALKHDQNYSVMEEEIENPDWIDDINSEGMALMSSVFKPASSRAQSINSQPQYHEAKNKIIQSKAAVILPGESENDAIMRLNQILLNESGDAKDKDKATQDLLILLKRA